MAGKSSPILNTRTKSLTNNSVQVQVFSNSKKKYRGQITHERIAAKIYDKRAIVANGLRAKTNFNYSKKELLKLLKNEEDLSEDELLR